MKSNIKKVILIFLGFWIIFSPILIFNYQKIQINNDTISDNLIQEKQPVSSAVYNVPYIHILYNWSETASAYPWCTGDGSLNNPYTIENVIINATDVPVFDPLPNGVITPGIFIAGITGYSVIKNCTVFASEPDSDIGYLYNYIYGVYLYGTSNVTLIDNNFFNCKLGIRLEGVQNCTITGNTINNNYDGGSLSYTYNIEVIDNSICLNDNNGLLISDSGKTIISNNNISSNGQDNWNANGLSLGSNYSEISDNIISNNAHTGIYLAGEGHCNVSNNIVDHNGYGGYGGDGIHLFTCDYNNVTYNTIRNNDENGIDLGDSSYNRIIGNKLSGNGECIAEDEEAIGNVVENNDCGEEGIPGFNLYITICVIGVISLILIKRRVNI